MVGSMQRGINYAKVNILIFWPIFAILHTMNIIVKNIDCCCRSLQAAFLAVFLKFVNLNRLIILITY